MIVFKYLALGQLQKYGSLHFVYCKRRQSQKIDVNDVRDVTDQCTQFCFRESSSPILRAGAMLERSKRDGFEFSGSGVWQAPGASRRGERSAPGTRCRSAPLTGGADEIVTPRAGIG